MRARVGRTLRAAEIDESFSRAVAALIEAAHAFNRWDPSAVEFDVLCEAAEEYVIQRQRLVVRLSEE